MDQSIQPSSNFPPPIPIPADGGMATRIPNPNNGHLSDSTQRQSRRSSLFARFSTPLPPKHHLRILRHARHTFLNVYRRLFSLVFLCNIIGLFVFSSGYDRYSKEGWLANLANAAAANIMVAILIRQDYVVNMLFR
jgi:hypothetical protein